MPYKNLYLIGLTGNVACGKSTVIAMLRDLGAQVLDADAVTHALQQPGQDVYQQIVAAFGEQILVSPNGPIDRRALAAIVFSDPVQLQRLEQIVHPAVHSQIYQWLDSVAAGNQARNAVIDAIKLLEGGWQRICDSVWVVTSSPEQQLMRLMTTRNMDETEARRRIAAQAPQADKIAQADVLIDNSGSLAETQQQVVAAWQRIKA